MEVNYAGLEHLDRRAKRQIYQELSNGRSPMDVAIEFGAPVEPILNWMKEQDSQLSAAARRQLALMRIDQLGAKILGLSTTTDDPDVLAKISSAWTQLNKREAALAGLDAPTRQEADVRVQVAWLQPGRLSYKDGAELAEDIVAKNKAPARAILPPPEPIDQESED